MASKDRTVAPKKVLEMMKEITGQSDDDVCAMLQLCNGDATLATEKLLECRWQGSSMVLRSSGLTVCPCAGPFEKVVNKKEKRKQVGVRDRAPAPLFPL